MKHLSFVWFLALAGLAHAQAPAAKPGPDPLARPNIVFLLTDDHRADVLSCAGHAMVKTPNIDKLAAGGVRYANAFVTTSICAASRATIFTGLVERTHGYTFGTPPIATRFVDDSYPVKLREAGYRTGFFGKFGVQGEGGKAAIDRMFDRFEDLPQPFLRKQPDGSVKHVDDLIGDRAIQFLREQPADKPFCLSLSFNGGHAADGQVDNLYPNASTEDDLYQHGTVPRPKLDDPAVYEAMPRFLRESMGRDRWRWGSDTPEKYDANMRKYFRLLSTVDRNVGRVMSELEARGLAENTIVIFTADNGYFMGERGLTGKWIHYEESLRVPLIVYDPTGRFIAVDPGTVLQQVALNIDIAPTVLDVAGVGAPDRYQGYTLTPMTDASRDRSLRTGFFCEHRMNNRSIPKWEGYRGTVEGHGPTVFVYANYYEQDPPYEMLHDLSKDPQELKNVADDPAYGRVLAQVREKTKRLSAEYAASANARAAAKDTPRVLLLGDSISMGYHPFVVAALKDEAFVTRPNENCNGTTYGVKRIDDWLKIDGGDWDVIHFNFGLHDLKAVTEPGGDKTTNNPDDPRQADLPTYEKNLRAIVARLKATGATLVFATTTPFPEGVKPHRLPEDAVRYNEVALKIMKENGIAIDDLYSFVLPRMKELQQPKNVHFTKQGSEALAGEVVKSLRAAMKK